MLMELHIENLAIIDQLRIDFHEGLNVLTGETGAGKSIILNALNLILGDRVKDAIIRSHEEEGLVEALFDISASPRLSQWLTEKGIEAEDTIVIKRVLSRKDKSKIYINGQLATLQMVSLIAEELLNIYGQHQHQILKKVENHLDILDEFGGLLPLKAEFQEAYREHRGLGKRLEALKEEQERGERERDLWAFQLKEIEAAALKPGEEEGLKQERHLMKNAQRLMQLAGSSERLLYSEGNSIVERLGTVERDIEALAELDPTVASLKNAVSSALLQLEEASGELKGYLAKIDMDPNRLEEIELRFDELQMLKRKYKAATVEEILAYKERIERGVQGTADLEAEIAQLERKKQEGAGKVREQAQRLSQGRREAGLMLKQEIEAELATLAMERTTFEVEMKAVSAGGDALEVDGAFVGPRGGEEIEFLISPNVGEEPRPLSKIASGGELSRIMLAIKKILTKGAEDQTLVFDEVDAGIGGHTAEVVGHKLRDLARYHQILCVTHLPQIAAFGKNHYQVSKREAEGRTMTSVERLQGDMVVEEIARMLGGKGVTAATRTHAQEMLQKARLEER
ncbi:MAG: DNA repair protein RecN [Deltaproteobacteria bacterium RBG_16_54_11]|nr:MAG: DNA repair protein RecN [Deltaproteobacteria bacterium RBG_16_54_11]